MDLSRETIQAIVQHALHEDIGQHDLTTQAVIPTEAQAEANIIIKEAGMVAGLPVLAAVFETLDPTLLVSLNVAEGDSVVAGDCLAHITGYARPILTGERVALNLLQRMCGIATLTAQYVAAIEGLSARILDTRKTTPGLRAFEKYAVHVGGGVNHRFGLYDSIMLKDNHLALLESEGYDIGQAVQRAKAAVGPTVCIEVEVETVEQAALAAEAGVDMILLDNMRPTMLRKAVTVVAGRAILEASGGITLNTIRAVAETGVDYISVGALTHSVRVLDIGLDMQGMFDL